MARLILILSIILCSLGTQGRSMSYVLKATGQVKMNVKDSAIAGAARTEINTQHNGLASRYTESEIKQRLADRYRRRKTAPLRYDVTREAGSYFFDTVYKLRVPAARHLQLGINGGYTFYDRYVHGFGKAGSLGVVGGISLMIVPPAGKASSGKKGFLRLNADLTSYPYRKGSLSDDGRQPALLDKYTRELSTRIYMDAKFSWRARKGAFTTRYMAGFVSGTEQLTATTPFFIGLGVGYRFL